MLALLGRQKWIEITESTYGICLKGQQPQNVSSVVERTMEPDDVNRLKTTTKYHFVPIPCERFNGDEGCDGEWRPSAYVPRQRNGQRKVRRTSVQEP